MIDYGGKIDFKLIGRGGMEVFLYSLYSLFFYSYVCIYIYV